jgi:hypothetical protein
MNAPPSAQLFVKTNLNNLVKAETCDYCGIKAVTQGKPTLWDPNLRKQLPFRDSSHPDAPPPLKYCDWDVPPPWFPMSNHFPHAWNWEAKDYSRAPVALFRDPRKRIVSAWNNNKHSFGVGNFNNPYNKSYARQIVNDLETVFDFAQHPPIQSCQTKMMLAEVRPCLPRVVYFVHVQCGTSMRGILSFSRRFLTNIPCNSCLYQCRR